MILTQTELHGSASQKGHKNFFRGSHRNQDS